MESQLYCYSTNTNTMIYTTHFFVLTCPPHSLFVFLQTLTECNRSLKSTRENLDFIKTLKHQIVISATFLDREALGLCMQK